MYIPDKKTVEIINLLMEDGRMSCAEISRRVGGISERAVRYRIEKLVKQGVIEITAVPNAAALGLPIKADVFIEADLPSMLDIAETLAGNENISYVGCSIGETDVSVQIYAKDTNSVYQFVTEVIAKIPGVRKTKTAILPIILKDTHQWRIPKKLINEILNNAAVGDE
jgi:Lrp/AsnC family transcriptional regulator for asnA, asnC and gidA